MAEQSKYKVILECVALGISQHSRIHKEMHFVSAESDEVAKKEAQKLVDELREWDSSYMRRVQSVLDPDGRKIF